MEIITSVQIVYVTIQKASFLKRVIPIMTTIYHFNFKAYL